MDHFQYKHGIYHAEDMPLDTLATLVETPFYCYSAATLRHHAQVFMRGIAGLNHRVPPKICFAVKANPNPHVLRLLKEQGLGADVVSEGEIRLALAAGIPAQDIVFSGVGKKRQEMRFALQCGVFQFNVESAQELHVLHEEAQGLGVLAPIALRVNPNVDAVTHEKITTGRKDSKFGIDIEQASEIYALAHSMPYIKVQGISVHIGSQLTQLEPFARAFARVRDFVLEMRAQAMPIDVVDLGGGLGIPYHPEHAALPEPDGYGAMICEAMQGLEAHYVFEPGRLIAGNAGVLVASVIYTKEAHDAQTDVTHRFMIIDAGMNDLMRPAMYGAHHEIVPVSEAHHHATHVSQHVVGPVCESSDVFLRHHPLPLLHEDDLVVIRSAGAYGASMSSTYNARLQIPEVLVDGTRMTIIRPRETYEEMLARY
ncbi:MAG: diaminopimelate decarboxylase [Alphaproteobacteria bacterium]|nr:MAG: diaminopimelate decarboxylase [Alphaproteobacteria bacterium]